MIVSTRGRYGVKALLDLALHDGEGPSSTKAVAERQGLPEAYLEQLMGPLRKAGIVRSVRGPQGGYVLGASAREITLLKVVEALEGDLSEDGCRCGGAAPDCLDHTLWRRLGEHMAAFLEGMTLADLAEEQRLRAESPIYYI